MTRGLEVRVTDLKGSCIYVQLLNGQKWRIENDKAFRYATLFENGKPQPIDFAKSTLEKIYPEIKLLFDTKGRVIAQRLNRNCRLLTTRENKWLKVEKNKKINDPRKLEIYVLLSGIEENEYVKQMNTYIYSK